MAVSRNRNKDTNNLSEFENYGDVLRKTRERHGIAISEVADELRVREDILMAIESGDFSKIPHQGFSRNMIKSYSRLLGLDANRITSMFLDAEYSYQLGKKRKTIQKISEENKKRVPMESLRDNLYGSKTPRQQLEEERKGKVKNIEDLDSQDIVQNNTVSPFSNRQIHVFGNKYKNSPRSRRESDLSEDLHHAKISAGSKNYEKFSAFAEVDYNSAKARLEARRRAHMTDNDSRGDNNSFSEKSVKKRKFSGLRARQKIDRNAANSLSNEENPNYINPDNNRRADYQFMNIYHNKSATTQPRYNIFIIGGIVVVLLIVLVLFLFLMGRQEQNSKTDVSNISVTGLTDPEKQNNNEEPNTQQNQQQNITAEEPKVVDFKYKVKDGTSVYMEVYENGSSHPSLARQVKGGETDIFKVTDSLKFVVTNPSAVDIFVADEKVEPVDKNGTGVYTYEFTLKSYVEQWKKKSGNVKSNSSSSQSNSANNQSTDAESTKKRN